MPKNPAAACTADPNKSGLEAKIATEITCPKELCQAGEPGCKPKVTLEAADIEEITTRAGAMFCCLKKGLGGNSVDFDLRCTLCADPG